jgi:tetratricopeptide (TPR) repeat protein
MVAEQQQDLTLLLAPEPLAAARALAVASDGTDLAARYLLGWFHYYRLNARADSGLTAGQDQADAGPDPAALADFGAATENFAACLVGGYADESLPDDLLPAIADKAIDPATALLEKAVLKLDPAVVAAAATTWEWLLAQVEDDHPDRAEVVANFADAMHARFLTAGDRDDIEAAVATARQAVDDTAADAPLRPRVLSSLSEVLRTRFTLTRDGADLDAAVDAARESLQSAPRDYLPRPALNFRLGAACMLRWEVTRNPRDLMTGIRCLNAAAAGTVGDLVLHPMAAAAARAIRLWETSRNPDTAVVDTAIAESRRDLKALPAGAPGRDTTVLVLANSLALRARLYGGRAELDEAVAAAEEAVREVTPGSPTSVAALDLLGHVLLLRAERGRDPADFDAAVAATRQAVLSVPEGAPERAGYQENLARALRIRSIRTGRGADADEAARIGSEAVAATAGTHPRRAERLAEHSAALRDRIALALDDDGIDEAVAAGREAVATTRESAAELADLRFQLGDTLLVRYQRTRQAADLDEAIEVLRKAVRAEPIAPHLAMLSRALRLRFRHTGGLPDLDDAIKTSRRAVEAASPAGLVPIGDRDTAAILSDLGLALQNRYGRTDDLADLDDAIAAFGDAVRTAVPGDPDLARYQSNQGSALLARYGRTRAATDLREAIRSSRAAVTAAHDDHAGRPVLLGNLGVALLASGTRLFHRHDLDASISAFGKAIAELPTGHPDRAALLLNTGLAWQEYFTRTRRTKHAARAARAHAEAASIELAAPSLRIRAAREAAGLLAGPDPEQAAELLEKAVLLMPEVAPRELTRPDQQYAIGGFAGLAADAAALALAAPGQDAKARATRALRLLEAGRTIIIGQLLDAREDLTELRTRDPSLAERFSTLRDQLDQPSSPGDLPDPDGMPGSAMAERRMLRAEFARVLADIRALDGLAAFGQPPAVTELAAEGAAGPVVTLNISRYGSHALLLTAADITAIPLRGLTLEAAEEQARALQQALDAIRYGERDAEETVTRILGWLWDTVADPVLTALGYDRQPASDAAWPRVWWIPCGMLGLLPVHAAGYHAEQVGVPAEPAAPAPRTVLDRVISSYAPTVRALHHARRANGQRTATAGALVVAMPTTPGLPLSADLPYAGAEARLVARLLPCLVVLAEGGLDGIPTETPTRANVLAGLRDATTAHFACHASSDPADPSRGMLLLHDHADAPLTVAELAPYHHGRLQIVYLSACGTSIIERAELADEVIHLTSAFLVIGARHVVGTLWEVNDRLASRAAESFYEQVVPEAGELAAERSARALHEAVRQLREPRRSAPSAWAAYLHVGA